MAAPPGTNAGIPLTEYRRDVPPGWQPALPDYPLRLYFDKLTLRYRVYDGPDECVGPLVAGRLHGRAHRIALQLRVPRPDGTFDQGDSALVRLAVDEVRDPICQPQSDPAGPYSIWRSVFVQRAQRCFWAERSGHGFIIARQVL